jgi:hypothetical protein
MLLRNPHPASAGDGFVPAWSAIEPTQHCEPGCWLIAQPDHAELAGDLARRFAHPALDGEIIEAIRLHDAGWAALDEKELDSDRPRSFLAMSPAEFVAAWTASIDRAQLSSAIGGIIVSRHFCRLAEDRLARGGDTGDDLQLLNDFLRTESLRQQGLLPQQARPREEAERLVDILQFCDLASLYLCCGSPASVEFPQQFDGGRIRLRRQQEACVFEPSPFGGSFDLAISGRRRQNGLCEGKNFTFLIW